MAVAISGYDIYAPVFMVSLTKIGKDIPRESISSIEIDENRKHQQNSLFP